jgi:hypothetical protein
MNPATGHDRGRERRRNVSSQFINIFNWLDHKIVKAGKAPAMVNARAGRLDKHSEVV